MNKGPLSASFHPQPQSTPVATTTITTTTLVSSISPSTNSLPARPPASLVPSRKSSTPQQTPSPSATFIIPALPMAVLSKKPYPPPGIGRGHSSLPPKPGFVGKPLPRDTDAIVLTPGGESLSFAPSTKSKRTYSSVASENIMRPMDPAVTNLTPQNRVSPSATNHHGIPHSITPPAEIAAAKGSPLAQVHMEANNNSNSHHNSGSNISASISSPRSLGPKPRTDHPPNGSIDGQLVRDSGNKMDHPQMYRPENHPQQANEHSQRVSFPSNGVPPSEMYHPVGPQFGIHHPPPHPHHHQAPGFYPQHPYHGGTLTPPNTGPIYLTPTMPPHMEQIMYSDMVMNASPDGSGPGPAQHNIFGSGYGGFQPPTDHTGHHPAMQHFAPMPAGPNAQVQSRQDEHQRLPTTPPPSSRQGRAQESTGARKEQPRNARLKGITFFVDEDSKEGKQTIQTPITSSGRGTPTSVPSQAGPNGGRDETPRPPQSVTPPSSLEFYMREQFLSKRLADVTLILIDPATRETQAFPAHSFVLGRSDKLYGLLEHADKSDTPSSPMFARTYSSTSWADEMEGEEPHSSLSPVRAGYCTTNGLITITFETSVNRESFLLALKTLYGAPDWELDAFLDPSHPDHHVANEIASHHSDSSPDEASVILRPSSPESGLPEDISPQVQMLERAISLFSAGVLLGLDVIIQKAIENIKHWGLNFEGGAFERLMKFLLEESEGMKNDKALISPHWDFTGALLDEAVDRFARSIPEDFKLDKLAPNSKHLNRLGNQAQLCPLGVNIQQKRIIRQVQSTILISLPFDVMKKILEHSALASTGRKKLFDLASSVVQERERRRKRELRVVQDFIDRRNGSESGRDSASDIISADTYPEVLCWEESAVSTFGHGPVGIEIAKRRKGGPGGRMLWKVGNRASN